MDDGVLDAKIPDRADDVFPRIRVHDVLPLQPGARLGADEKELAKKRIPQGLGPETGERLVDGASNDVEAMPAGTLKHSIRRALQGQFEHRGPVPDFSQLAISLCLRLGFEHPGGPQGPKLEPQNGEDADTDKDPPHEPASFQSSHRQRKADAQNQNHQEDIARRRSRHAEGKEIGQPVVRKSERADGFDWLADGPAPEAADGEKRTQCENQACSADHPQ